MRNLNEFYLKPLCTNFLSLCFLLVLSNNTGLAEESNLSFEDDCWITLKFKNEGCHTGSLYKYSHGKYVYLRDLKQGESVKTNAQKGSDWAITDGHTIKKRYHVSSCYDQWVRFDLGACHGGSGSDGYCAPTIKFKNSHCKDLDIYSTHNGHLVHYATIAPHSHWSTDASKGSEWIIKEGHKQLKHWKVPSCEDRVVDLKFGYCHDDSNCDAKIIFKNDYCHSLKIYHENNGHLVFKKELHPNVSWGSYSKVGHNWVIRKGYTTMKTYKVPSCNTHTVELNFSGCGGSSSSNCSSRVTFYNKNCSSLDIYRSHQGRLYHFKTLHSNANWYTSTQKGHEWVIKKDHKVMKNWKVTSCYNQNVDLDFGGCSDSHYACSVNLGFYNKDCEKLSIFFDYGGKLTHYKDLGHKGYWKVKTKKGHKWVIKQGDVIKKTHVVSQCHDVNIQLDFGGCDQDLCSDGSPKKAPGTYCNDYDSSTENDVIQDDGCTCKGTPKTTNNSNCDKSYDDFESGWGNWYDGGSNCVKYYDPHGPLNGNYAVRIRDNKGWSSSTYTRAYNLHGHSSVTVGFHYYTTGMSHGATFALEYSTDDGKTWWSARKWKKGTDYTNNRVYHESVTFSNHFSTKTRFRMRCYASGSSSYVHFDDMKISSCHQSNFSNGTGKQTSFGKSIEIGEVSEISIHPNPVAEVMRVEGLGVGDNYSIYNFAGQAIMQNVKDSRVNLSNLSQGAYFIKTSTGVVKRFIKK